MVKKKANHGKAKVNKLFRDEFRVKPSDFKKTVKGKIEM